MRHLSLAALLFLASPLLADTSSPLPPASSQPHNPPYLDPTQPMDKRVDDLLSRMTLDEKALELFHNAPAIERLHIPRWGGWNQCLHGVWSKQPTTEFPVSIAAAATWDPTLIHEEAVAISDEARALYNIQAQGVKGTHGLVYRAPVINISRNPRWGRIQECYGEDDLLAGKLAVAYVNGLQNNGAKYLKLAATLKHFAINNVEEGRKHLSATVPERIFYEYWMPHYRMAITEGHACSVMAAYNAINGVPCIENHFLLTDVLRNQWHFDGFVTSDLTGVRYLVTQHHISDRMEVAVADALKAGCDMDDEEYRDEIPKAVHDGLLSEETVNTAARRVLRIAFRLGAFDPPALVPYSRIDASVINSAAHRKLAYQVEAEAITLLSNPAHFLPLDRSRIHSIAVIGPLAERPEYGNYFGVAPERVGPEEGLRKKLANGNIKITRAEGCTVTGAAKPDDIAQAVTAAKSADVALLFLGTTNRVEAEDRDRKNLDLPGDQEQLLEAVVAANPHTVVILSNAGPLAVNWAKDHAAAILETWFPGEEGGAALADALFGDINPAGRLPYTNYATLDDVPPVTQYDITKGFTYMYYPGKPLFPFGHGLSYTTFSYSPLSLSESAIPPAGQFTVSVDVQNTGDRAGDEVVQLYTHQLVEGLVMPKEKLAAFQRIHLAPGEKKTVTLPVNANQLAYYDVNVHHFVTSPGTVDILVGASSGDIRQRGQVTITAPK